MQNECLPPFTYFILDGLSLSCSFFSGERAFFAINSFSIVGIAIKSRKMIVCAQSSDLAAARKSAASVFGNFLLTKQRVQTVYNLLAGAKRLQNLNHSIE
jgi:hypothetical protein